MLLPKLFQKQIGDNNIPCKYSKKVDSFRKCGIKLEDEEESYYPGEEVEKYCKTENYSNCPRYIPGFGTK
ncbi:MAG TPA: hypothetical protein HA261_02190 [Methanosarcina sp.]|nr:hypothetical protein [Methanosarcina sp.]